MFNVDLGGKVGEVTELRFPEDGIVRHVTDDCGRTGRVRASRGKPRGIRTDGKVEVPRETCEGIRGLAELTRKADRLAADLGAAAAVKGLFAKKE